jgi:DNA-binding MarR family transcriptional regulator
MKNFEETLFSMIRVCGSIQRLNKQAESQLSLSLVQWCFLKRLIDRPGISSHALADVIGVHASTLTQTVKRLERKGFIFVTDDPKDSRKKIISITRLGAGHLQAASARLESWLTDHGRVISDATGTKSKDLPLTSATMR